MIRIGVNVKDKASGITGLVTGRYNMFNGCTQWEVQPLPKPGETDIPKGWRIDGFTLEVLDDGIVDMLPPEDTSVKVKIGDRVKDTISLFTGIAVERFTSQNGCVCFLVTARDRVNQDGLPPKVWVDHKALEVTRDTPLAASPTSKTGAPSRVSDASSRVSHRS